MSTNPTDELSEQIVDQYLGGEDPGWYKDQIVPKLVQETENGRREFEPIVVTRLGGTLPWETESRQLQCGETVTSNNGDMNIRLVYECVCTHTQFKKLQQMRSEPTAIKLVSAAYSNPITFDELKFDRIPDANGGIIRGEGENNEPRYKIQLQSKESESNSML